MTPVEGDGALRILAEQCDSSAEKLTNTVEDLERAQPTIGCQAHWPMVKVDCALVDGVKTLLLCQREEYRQRLERQNRGGDKRQLSGAGWLLRLLGTGRRVPQLLWAIMVLIAMLAGAGALKGVVDIIKGLLGK